MFETMKKTYLIPETLVRKSLLMQTYMLDLSNTPADPGAGVDTKERYEGEDEKGYGQYQW
jgi:hypothetical protein